MKGNRYDMKAILDNIDEAVKNGKEKALQSGTKEAQETLNASVLAAVNAFAEETNGYVHWISVDKDYLEADDVVYSVSSGVYPPRG